VHISEFGSEEKMKEALEVGKEYDYTILSIEPRDYKMALGFGKKRTKDGKSASLEGDEKTANETVVTPEAVTETVAEPEKTEN
jgi:ribosomal protein S1